jgi:protein subunit release factor A
VTHIPSGLSAECDTESSQHRNRSIAIDMILGGLTSPHFRR